MEFPIMRLALSLQSAAALVAFLLIPQQGMAQSIEETLAAAYNQSTQLEQQRAQQRATDENVPQALSNWRPTVTVNGNITRSHSEYTPDIVKAIKQSGISGTDINPFGTSSQVAIQVTQPIYRGGRTTAQTSQATNLVKSGQSQLKATEQSVLLNAATSYLDVVRDQATVDLNASNVAVLKKQLDAELDRFRVGEVTRTDVALSQASYDNARAQYISAVGLLATDRATFQRVVGQAPGKLVQPPFKYKLPASLEEAVADAEENNPSVIAAEYTEHAARDAVDVDEGARLPTISIVGTYSRDYVGTGNSSSAGSSGGFSSIVPGGLSHIDSGTVEAQMTLPLYTGGLTSSQIRQAKHTANQNLIAIEDAKRVARQTAIQAWQQLTAAKANIEALTSAANAAQIGAEGTRQQALVGTSTVLDALIAEQNLLQAQVNLVGAQHDALVDSFSLLASVGRMTGPDLALPVKYYDPQVNFERVQDKWMGTGID
jgi:outer membrane protein/adhesin transport system outer membrane protein